MELIKDKGLGNAIGETKIDGKMIKSYERYAILVSNGTGFNVGITQHPMNARDAQYLFTTTVSEVIANDKYEALK